MCFNDFDFDNDYEEDFIEDQLDDFGTEKEFFGLEKEQEDVNQEDDKKIFDFEEAFVIGGMIAGNAYEDALDEQESKEKKGKIRP